MMASSTNDFTVSCLLETRIESFNKKQRERILKGWLPKGDSKDDELRGLTYTNALDPAILSLKIKIMENAMFYDVSLCNSRYKWSLELTTNRVWTLMSLLTLPKL